jgi:adenosine deaminase
MNKYINKFYLDKEKDIIVNLYKTGKDEIEYVLETPNHNTGNLITNLAKILKVETQKNKNDMKIIKGKIPASINGDNKEVYIFRLGGFKIANIYENGNIEIKAKIPAITKTLMSQTKEYKIPIEKTIVKSYLLKKTKFRTDLHTHMNANLSPDILISLGIKHQIKYPLYYIKKLNLKITKEQEERIYQQREEIEKKFVNSELKGKYLIRKIDDNTFINFADLILNNLENVEYNISEIRTSLSILKDGQAVFTNLEKLYIYRYVFCKGIESEEKIKIENEKIEKIPESDIKNILKLMLKDSEKENLKTITLRQDKLLWVGREYSKQGINYVEITDTDLAKSDGPAIKLIEEIHEIMPHIEKETGVKIRFLVGLRRIPLTIIKDQIVTGNYLRKNLDVLKTVAKSPYIVGSDFIGEETNDITELRPVIKELVEYVQEDKDFTIRIHAGENDSLKDNVAKSIECVQEALTKEQEMPRVRLGHGIYTANLKTKEGKKLIENIKKSKVVLEFQLTSNVRLNNLNDLKKHPIKQYLKENIKCIQGTDGCGFYGTDAIDEQLALQNLLELDEQNFLQMRKVEEEIIERNNKYFEDKTKKFEKFLNGRTIREALTQEENENHLKNKNNDTPMRIIDRVEADKILKEKVKQLPEDKIPIIIAGGSFNNKGRKTYITNEGKKILERLIKRIDSNKAYFVIGHTVEGYEKAIIDLCKKLNKKFEINAIIPRMISKEEVNKLSNKSINGIRVSIENDAMGIYKSFNYEIFERRNSILIAFDGNSPVSNLVQEANNGKGKSKIYVNEKTAALKDKAKYLQGYVTSFNLKKDIVEKIIKDNPEIENI